MPKKTAEEEVASANFNYLAERIHFCEGGIKAAAKRCETMQLQIDGLARLVAGKTQPPAYECGACLAKLTREVSYDERSVYVCPKCKHSIVAIGELPEVPK